MDKFTTYYLYNVKNLIKNTMKSFKVGLCGLLIFFLGLVFVVKVKMVIKKMNNLVVIYKGQKFYGSPI